MNPLGFFFKWICDPRANRVQEIHAYGFLLEKIKRLLTGKSFSGTELKEFKQLLSEEKGNARLSLTDDDILVDGKIALRQWLEQQAS